MTRPDVKMSTTTANVSPKFRVTCSKDVKRRLMENSTDDLPTLFCWSKTRQPWGMCIYIKSQKAPGSHTRLMHLRENRCCCENRELLIFRSSITELTDP